MPEFQIKMNKILNHNLSERRFSRPTNSIKIKSILGEAGFSSTVHGINHILKAQQKGLKSIWFISLLISTSYCVYLIKQAIFTYYSYPVTTKTSYYTDQQVTFPVVAFCNVNAMTTQYSIDYLYDFLTNNSYGSSKTLESLNELLNGVQDLNQKVLSSLFFLNDTTRKKLGLQLVETLVKCRFNGQECDASDFVWFFDYNHGNCFAFNRQKASYKIKVAGEPNKLSLELFAGLKNETVSSTGSYGFKIMIFNQTEDEKQSQTFEKISVSLSTELSIMVNRFFVKKRAYPYSECLIDSETASADSYDSELFKSYMKTNKTYKQNICMEYCFRDFLVGTCNCTLSERDTIKTYAGIPLCRTYDEIKCGTDLYFDVFKAHGFDGQCYQMCPLECDYKYFGFQMSAQTFPSKYYANFILKNNSYLSKLFLEHALTVEEVAAGVSRVNVYLKDLSYQYSEEAPTYLGNDLIGTIGGLLGLFMGASFLSFFELFDILIQIVYLKLK